MHKEQTIKKLTQDELAEAIYEGTSKLQNLAEMLARSHGNAQALTFYSMMGEDIQNFYRHLAHMLIQHAEHWKSNEGCACVLDDAEALRIRSLIRVEQRTDIIGLLNALQSQHLSCDGSEKTVILKFDSLEDALTAYRFIGQHSDPRTTTSLDIQGPLKWD